MHTLYAPMLPQVLCCRLYQRGNVIHSSPAVVNGVLYLFRLGRPKYSSKLQRLVVELYDWTLCCLPQRWCVYIGSGDQQYLCLKSRDRCGVMALYNSFFVFSSPAVANGVVYIGSYDQKLYALNATTGKRLWSYHETKSTPRQP